MDASGEEMNSSDGSANMTEEEWLEGKSVAYHAGYEELVAADSGCNRLVLKSVPTIEECPNFTYEPSAVPCYLGTAAAGGKLDIAGSGIITSEDGVETVFKHCPPQHLCYYPSWRFLTMIRKS